MRDEGILDEAVKPRCTDCRYYVRLQLTIWAGVWCSRKAIYSVRRSCKNGESGREGREGSAVMMKVAPPESSPPLIILIRRLDVTWC
jgi:hypothetical protein